MRAVLDHPDAVNPMDRHRFSVRGWVWPDAGESPVGAVEIWSGDVLLGQTGSLVVRPDVNAALVLPADARAGFDFLASLPAAQSGREAGLHLRFRLADGTCTGPLCAVRVSIAGKNGPPPVTAATPSRPSGKTEALPPDHLQTRQVGGVWGPAFYTEGRVILDQLAAAFREAGRPLEEAEAILDFGCGCGRVLRNFQDLPHAGKIFGCDIDAESIAWNQDNLGHLAEFSVNPTLPPTRFADGFFDAIYVVSVFTHLPEELQFAWLAELRRILRPGGVLIASLHGAHYWGKSDATVQAEIAARGFAYRTGLRTAGLPDFYMVAFHSEAYVCKSWTWFFEFVALKESYIHGVHDAVILRRRDD